MPGPAAVRRYTRPVTTVEIDEQVRDRLRALAQRHGRNLGEEIAALVERAEQVEPPVDRLAAPVLERIRATIRGILS